MVRLPKKVEINGRTWRVVVKPLVHRGMSGQCVHRKREIQIERDLPADEVAETFLHELMHACLTEDVANRTEETLVARLAPRLLAALKGIGWAR